MNGINMDFKKPTTFLEFAFCDNEEFKLFLHVSRDTTMHIIQRIGDICEGNPHSSEFIPQMVVMVLWFLSNESGSLEDAVNIFNLETVENARYLLDQGFNHIMKLKAESGICWPETEGLLQTALCFERMFCFPGVAGVLCHEVLTCTTGHRLMIQGLCNEKGIFIDVTVSFDTRPNVVFLLSDLKETLLDIHTNELIIISEEFSTYAEARKNIFFPLKGDYEIPSIEKQMINTKHHELTSFVKTEISKVFRRFPRLKSLERCEREIVVVAFILHNYCQKFYDVI